MSEKGLLPKVLLVLALLFLSCFSVFAETGLEIVGGFPFFTQKHEGYYSTGSDVVPGSMDISPRGFSVGVFGSSFKEDKIVGTLGYVGLNFITKLKVEQEIELPGEDLESSDTIDVDDAFDSYKILNIGFGIGFKVLSLENVNIVLAPLVNFRYEFFKNLMGTKGTDVFLGVGGAVGLDYNFTDSFYATAKAIVTYDFFLFGDDEETCESGMSILPMLGVGFRL